MMEILKKRYKPPVVKVKGYEGFVLTDSGEGDPVKDPSRVDIYANAFKEDVLND